MAGGHYRDRMPDRVIYLQVAHHEHAAEFGRWQFWKEWRCAAALRVDYSCGCPIAQASLKTDNTDRLWVWVASQVRSRRATWLVAADLGVALTLSAMWRRIGPSGYRLSRIVMNDPPTVLTVDMGKGVLQCVDIRNYLPSTALPLLSGETHSEKSQADYRDDNGYWLEWCAEKCQSLATCFGSIMNFVAPYGKDQWATTLPSIAWRIWRTWYAQRRTCRCAGTAFRDLERSAYYPGECAAYRVGKHSQATAHCDVNSLYPWAMLHGQYPISPLAEGENAPVCELRNRCNDGICAARVCVLSEDVPYPRREAFSVFRTVGKFWTVLCGPELRHALDSGRVRACAEWVHYQSGSLFHSWVWDMYRLRMDAKERGDREREGVVKLLMNSLAGKFNQRLSDWIDRPDMDAPDPYGCWTCYDYLTSEARYFRAIAGHVQERVERKDWAEAKPLIAACITSYGRERMRQLRASVGDGTVYYQDTDCLILALSSWRKLVGNGEASDTRLGGLRLLGVYDGAYIYGPKRYSLGGKVTVAGVDRAQAVSVDGSYARTAQQSLASSLLDEPQGYVGFERKKVKLADLPRDATVCQDGTVLPITMWED